MSPNKLQYNYQTSSLKKSAPLFASCSRTPPATRTHRQLLAHTASCSHTPPVARTHRPHLNLLGLFTLSYGRENRLLRSLRQSVRQYQSDSHWTDFCKI
jgi:hypothetical protein